MSSKPLVSYSRWRAVGAIAFPLIAIAIPTLNLVLNPNDFQHRWMEKWVGSIGFAVGIIWFVYALWPSAFRFLSGGPEEIRIEEGSLVFRPGQRFNLSELSAIEILRPWLQHPRIALQFGSYWAVIETAYQTLGERKPVEKIAEAIAAAGRAEA